MRDYLVVYHVSTRRFLLRFQIGIEPGAPEPGVQGILIAEAVEEIIAELQRSYPEPAFAVGRMSAGSWETVEQNFHGLYLY